MYRLKDFFKIKNKKEFFLAQFFAILATLISIPIPLLMPLLVDEVLLKKEGEYIKFLSHFLSTPLQYILFTLFLALFLRGVFVLFSILQNYYFEKIAKDLSFRLRVRILSHLKNLSLREFENLKSADIASRVINDIATIEEFFLKFLQKFFISILTILGVSIVLLIINLKLGLFIIFFNPFVVIFSTKMARKVKNLKKNENFSISTFQEALVETLDMLTYIKTYNKENFFYKKLIALLKEVKQKGFIYSFKSEMYSKISFLIFLSGFEVFRAAGIIAVAYDTLSIGLMIAVFSYLWFIISPIQEILSIQYSYFAAKGALERINEILSLKLEEKFKKRKNPFISDSVEIRLVKVSFSYEKEILSDIDATFYPFSINAIVGESGRGKSTLAKIIAGFYPPDRGDVLYNKVSYKEIGFDIIRKNVNLILQESKLFNDTLLFNLTLGEKFSEDEIIEVLKKVELYDLVANLKDGLNSYVGKDGIKLSGGERQRVALARALLFKPKVIILDESTSALDEAREERIFENIKDFLKSRTTIIIAHREKTIKKADNIIQL